MAEGLVGGGRAKVEFQLRTKITDNRAEFVRKFETGLRDAMSEMADDGMALATELAPRGTKVDPRTPSITNSMYRDSSTTSASWGSYAKHAAAQELGSKEHSQTGDVTFFWEKVGRQWHPGQNQIRHPGNPAAPYLRPSYRAIISQYRTYLERHLGRVF